MKLLLFALPGVLLTSLVWFMVVAISPSYSIATFRWADAPLSGPAAPILGASLYLAVVFSLWAYVRHAPIGSAESKLAVNAVQVVHNLVLAAWSLIMCLGCAASVMSRLRAAAWDYDWFFCEAADAEATADAEGAAVIRSLYFWAYCYYISKFYEFLDTILQLLKSGSVHSPWLHIFHHAVVPVMSWLWLERKQSLLFGGLIFNTFVHVPLRRPPPKP
jgi:fatty acid elongase 3